jgi:hypothetical protein
MTNLDLMALAVMRLGSAHAEAQDKNSPSPIDLVAAYSWLGDIPNERLHRRRPKWKRWLSRKRNDSLTVT